MSCTALSMDGISGEAGITIHRMYAATSSTMPPANENRNAVFITDHGSTRDSRSRALRVRRTGAACVRSRSVAEPWTFGVVGSGATTAGVGAGVGWLAWPRPGPVRTGAGSVGFATAVAADRAATDPAATAAPPAPALAAA